jgi:hypothetical protein
VVSGKGRNPKSHEMKAIATHRAHVEALAAWGMPFISLPVRYAGQKSLTDEEHALRC